MFKWEYFWNYLLSLWYDWNCICVVVFFGFFLDCFDNNDLKKILFNCYIYNVVCYGLFRGNGIRCCKMVICKIELVIL